MALFFPRKAGGPSYHSLVTNLKRKEADTHELLMHLDVESDSDRNLLHTLALTMSWHLPV